MNASLPDLQPALSGSGAKAADSSNVAGIQQDSGSGSDFAPLLEQAATEVDERLPAEAENLYRELQGLPEAGKLLPLLQQALDSVSAAGGEPREVLQQMAADVQELQAGQSLSLPQALTAVLSAYLNAAPAGPGAGNPGAATPPGGELLSSTLSWRTLQGADASPGAANGVPRLADAQAEAVRPGPDRPVVPMLQPVAEQQAQQGQPEQAVLAAAIRQFTRLQQSAGGDAGARTEPASALPVQLSPTAAAAQSVPATPVVSVAQSLNQPGWDEAFGEKIQWMMSQRMQGAQIRLNPAQLGPMEVSIQVRNDQASIQFSSAHAVVRDALEAAIPRLREMMESSGVELVDVDVSGQSFAERQATPDQEAVAWTPFAAGDSLSAETMIETSVASLLSSGRLDLFA